jgi:hypothetical protein
MEEVTINYHADNENFAEIIVQETNTGCAQSIEMSREAHRQLETLIANNLMSAGAASSNENGALSIQHVGDMFSLDELKKAYEAGENNFGCYTYKPFEEWYKENYR